MPNNITGFTGTEIVTRVVNFVGNTTTAFQTFVEQTLPLAEFRFCKMHNWRFLHKQNLNLTVSSGTDEYALSTANIGYYMAAEDVETIYDQSQGRVLQKVTLKDLRRLDADHNDGGSGSDLQYWAPTEDNKIIVWPPTFRTTTLKIDGKISPPSLTTLSNYPTIPYRYQEAFIDYVIALALERENDDRGEAKKASAIVAITQDIRDDLTQLGDTDQPRIHSIAESAVDGVGGGDLSQTYLNFLFSSWY